MTGKKLILMALALILLVMVALLQKLGGKSAASVKSNRETPLFAGIDLNTLTSIDVTKGSNTVSLIKPDGKWIVESLYGYPADFNKLANAMRTAALVELGSPVRAGNVAESEYGFDGSEKKVVLKAGDSTVATIAIGARRKGSDTVGNTSQCFIRKGDDPTIYLVDYDFGPFSDKAEAWMDKELVNVPSSDIVAVKTDEVDLKLDGTSWKLADLDPTAEEFQAPVANRLCRVLQYFSCESVADPRKSDEELGFISPINYTATTRDGFTYTVVLGAATDKGRYARLMVEYTRAQPPVAPEEDADQAKKDEYKKELDAYNTSAASNIKKAAELTARLSNWTYLIDTYNAESLTVPRKELVKMKASPANLEGDSLPSAK